MRGWFKRFERKGSWFDKHPGGESGAPATLERERSETEWRGTLSPERFFVLREKGTERAFSGEYWSTTSPGIYACAGCGLDLFHSRDKFDAGCGWPSYTAPIDDRVVFTGSDRSHGMVRHEALCAGCGGHLGHIFPDGPPPTGDRWCINSASITFRPLTAAEAEAAASGGPIER